MEQKLLNGTYLLLEKIGSGGSGEVYRAYHTRLKIQVVVKRLKGQVRGRVPDRAEADLLKNMKHAYLPRVYDIFEAGGAFYTVIDYIPGRNLEEVVRQQGPIPQKRVLKWAGQLAEALAYLHSMQPPVIHSDIKPANTMLTPEDTICLIDFNISLALDSTLRNGIGITSGYSPPEQYRSLQQYEQFLRASGRPAQVSGSRLEPLLGRGIDLRSDVYSLGATLYHLLTGVRPDCDFEKIVPLERSGVEISEGFAHIIGKMMELEPDKRYQNGMELLYALQHIQELDSEYRNWHRRQKLKKAAAGVLLAAGAVLTVTGLFMIRSETDTAYAELILSAETALEDSNYSEAAALLEEAGELLPSRSKSYSMQMLVLYNSGDYEGCLQYAEALLRDLPFNTEDGADDLANIYYVLGNACLELEDPGDAVTYLETALELSGGSSAYYRDYAIALARTGDIQQAETVLADAVQMGLGEGSIYMVQGEIAWAQQNYEDALEYLKLAISYSESDTLRRRAVLLCDRVYRALGTEYLDAEIAMLEQELSLSGGSAVSALSERLADAYVRKAEAEPEAASEYYQKALEQFESLYGSGYVTSQLLENMAILYENLDLFDEAEAVLTEMAALYTDSYVPYMRLAFLEADRQQMLQTEARDYTAMTAYYVQAEALYADDGSDQEMDMLRVMIQELIDGGWLEETDGGEV